MGQVVASGGASSYLYPYRFFLLRGAGWLECWIDIVI